MAVKKDSNNGIKERDYDEREYYTELCGCRMKLKFSKTEDKNIEDNVLMPLLEFLDREYLEGGEDDHVSFSS